MAKRSSKHENVQLISMTLNGGLNYSQSPSNIADNELKRAANFIYDPATDYLITRPGTICKTAAPLANPLLKGYYYEKSSTEAWHVCASGGKLWRLSGASLDGWTEIGALYNSTTTPFFLTFNNKLLIADGGDHIRTWDGTTYSTISTSPKATALSVIKNRVVANHVGEPDSVYFSAPNDAESADAWNTAMSAVGLKAGFGDMLNVNAFAVFGDDLIVSKVGGKEKRLYRITVADSTPANWYARDLSQNNAARNAHTMISAWNNIFFVDSNGFKSIIGTDTYGDLSVDAIGRKINTIFSQGYPCDGMMYLPSYNSLWFNLRDRIFCYTERLDLQTGRNIPAFTDLNFKWGRCTSMYEVGDIVYLTGYNGYLYKLNESVSTDEIAPGVTSVYSAAVRGKTFQFFADGILKKTQFYFKPKSIGQGNIYVCPAEDTKTLIKTITVPEERMYLYDATGYLSDANQFLFDVGASPWVETSRNRVRSTEMAFEFELASGRCGVEWCKTEIALVEGGD